MGNDFHISRAPDWGDAATDPIKYDEWIRYVRSDARLIEVGTLGLRNHDPAEQTVYALERADGPAIHWYRGGLVVTGARDVEVEHLRPIATALRARVQGDDGELY